MTASEYQGVAVFADQPATVTTAGKLVTSEKIRELLLQDERIVYGCALCDYVSETPDFPGHFRIHRTGKVSATKDRQKAQRAARRSARKVSAAVVETPQTVQEDPLKELLERIARLESGASGRPGAKDEQPKVANEPARQLRMLSNGLDGMWLCLVWTADRPDCIFPVGFFPNQTSARRYGQQNYPRRYLVGNMQSPAMMKSKLKK